MPTPPTARAALLALTVLAGCAGEPVSSPTTTAAERPRRARPDHATFRANLLAEYDLSDPQIAVAAIEAGGPPKDGIPALVAPARVAAADAAYPPDDGRVIAVEVEGEAVAYPIGILNFHEIANDTVGGVPVAVTYCPLCDSVAVLERRLDGTALEFGVSGLLHQSNVLMYDRATTGLWSQLGMRAVTGPHAGRALPHLPFRMMTFAAFREAAPDGTVLSDDTGHDRDYSWSPYAGYFKADRPFRDVDIGGEALPWNTLGVGVSAGSYTAFVTAAALRDEPMTLDTPAGPVTLSADDAGVQIGAAPADARVAQTFYHAWSALHPETRVITE
jgi:hypothetical protein